ncbi:MAG: AraC family transcriptional regulator [Paenibacillus sp.]|jgi:AraC-like DNA-binding protein|nr:AraC family transcriptional regulator [Paenibacillus sp.]
MDATALERCLPKTDNVMYWKQKERFLFEVDTHYKWMMFAVESGSFRYEIGEEKGIAERGDLVFCPPFVPFGRTVIRPLTFFVFNFSLEDGSSPAGSEETGACSVGAGTVAPSGLPAGKVTIRDHNRLFSDFDYLRAVWDLHEEPYMNRKQYLLQDIWRLYSWEAGEGRLSGDAKRDPLMEHAGQIIRERAHEPFSLKELAGQLGLSPVQLTRRFNASQHTTPGAYLTSIRLNRARALLVETDLTLDDIARRCGYDNGFYFSRAFSAKMGMPPSRYRQTNRL